MGSLEAMERQEGGGSMDRYFVKDTDKVKVWIHLIMTTTFATFFSPLQIVDLR